MSPLPSDPIPSVPCRRATRFAIASLAILTGLPAPEAGAQDTDSAPEPERRRRQPDPEKVHDPSTVLEQDGVHRFFATGGGVSLLREQADGRWLPEARLFERDELPAWHEERVPGNRGHLWAPDVIKLGGRYLVYYSVSTFGKNTSAIGLATGRALDPESPDWGWQDEGVIVSSTRRDRFNAIDPAIFLDEDGRLYMTFGSFWDGIFLVELDADSGRRRHPDKAPIQLASAPEIEAPFLTRARDGKYVLFVNWGLCCRGTNSTYEIRVGRSDAPTGPFLDRDGKDLREGGGTLILESSGRYIGPGHASILARDGKEYLVHHYYDGQNRGRSRARLLPLTWDSAGWPAVTGAPAEATSAER